MGFLESVILEVPDPAAAEAFNAATFGLGDKVRVRPFGGAVAPDRHRQRCRPLHGPRRVRVRGRVGRDRSDAGLRPVLPRPDR